MKKIVLTIILIILIIILVALSVFFMMNPVGKYPANEWHSRWECRRNHLAPILSALRSYKRSHDGKLPHDLEELVEKKILNKYDLICPSQHQRLQNDGYLKDGSSLTISSYRLLLPGHV
ncbi:MAG: hypothetical protein IID32_07865, partial [Planctomycetes bacterium]|nr:hypothetical protein [Planctomycetota bacterium]